MIKIQEVDGKPTSIRYTLNEPTSVVSKVANDVGYQVEFDAAKVRSKVNARWVWEAPLYKEEAEASKLSRCPRPTKPGWYLCQRNYFKELVQIRLEQGELCYVSHSSSFPLKNLEEVAEFWGPVEFE